MKARTRDLVVIDNPSLEASHQAIGQVLSQHRCLFVLGECRVEYQGRARSVLETGERMILVKSDGAVLVHRPTGGEPVN